MILNNFISSNSIIKFLTEVAEQPAKEVANFDKIAVSRVEEEAECEPEIILPLLVFLYNAMINRR